MPRYIILLLFIGNILYCQNEHFDKFVNIDGLNCFDFSYPFYYQKERETEVDNYKIYQFRIGETKQKSANFWIGVKEEDLYTIILSSDKIIKIKKLDLHRKKIKLLMSNGSVLKFKSTNKNKRYSDKSSLFYNVKITNQESILSEKYSHFISSFNKEYGFIFYFLYDGDAANSPYGDCYQL